MSKITAKRFKDLKNAVREECARRRYSGDQSGQSESVSVENFSSSDYDFDHEPAANARIRTEHYEKIAEPLNAINSNTFSNVKGDRVISEAEISYMEAIIANYSRSEETSSFSDCSGGCTGLCSGNCVSGCYSSCDDSCSDECYLNCSECALSCGYGGCTDQCYGTCYNTCYGSNYN